MSNAWQSLREELDLWQEPVSFWWRDDDAVADTPSLQKLIATQQENPSIPLHLASIPQLLETSLPPLVKSSPNVWILQHGFSHQNNASTGERKIELGGDQDQSILRENLASGRGILKQNFADRYLDVLVPPWNRVNATALSAIDSLHYLALSGLGLDKNQRDETPRLNVHIDIINWKQRCFVGTEACLEKIVNQLKIRRTEPAHRHEPLGLMTHHLAHDDDCWKFLSDFLQLTTEHAGTQWIQAEQAIAQMAALTPQRPDRQQL